MSGAASAQVVLGPPEAGGVFRYFVTFGGATTTVYSSSVETTLWVGGSVYTSVGYNTFYVEHGAFEFYLDKGILLADVHTNNVGVIEYRDEYADRHSTTWAITDPGHAVFLTTKFGENNFPFPKRST